MSPRRATGGGERLVLVHDYLTQRGGAERVVLAMTRGLGTQRLLTSLYQPSACFPEFAELDVRPSALQRIGFLRRHHRLALPLLPFAFMVRRVDADVVVCSTSGWAHGVRATGRKVLYVHNTARWLYQGDEYLGRLPALARRCAGFAFEPLRCWDRRMAAHADVVIANSSATAARIADHWGREAVVVRPPHGASPDGPDTAVHGLRPGFLLVVSRLLGYKHLDAIAAAVGLLPGRHLVIAGDGPDEARLRRLTGAGVTLLTGVGDDELRWLYRSCAAVVAAAQEDFGLVPLEAMAFGKPVVARRIGGYLETVVEDRTGVFFDEPEPEAIAKAIQRMEEQDWDPDLLRRRAAEFSPELFLERLRSAVDQAG